MGTEPDISLRPYDPGRDFEAMFAITREIVSAPPFEDARRELVAYPAKSTTALVAAGSDGEVVGFCAASHPYWNAVAILDYLVVTPPNRRRGIGERLVRATEESLSFENLRRVCVQTISWNVDAVRFYERLGFRRLATLPAYFDDEHDLVWLDRALPTAPSGSRCGTPGAPGQA